jgi:glycosyltransferase involved in cell wall biosynthesis
MELDRIRVLLFSTLYPNAVAPNHGVFVDNRLRHTMALGGIDATVLAPVPFFPFSHPTFGRYGKFARVPEREIRDGVEVLHPRYLVPPRVNYFTPYFLYLTALRAVMRLKEAGKSFDVIDAHYFYPDGVAAALLGRKLNLPVVITGRGTDLTHIPRDPAARKKIKWAAAQACATITVCEDLRQHLLALGGDAGRTLVLRNGVDLDHFSLGDRAGARVAHMLNRFTLLSVGSLIPRKGHHITIQALADLPDCDLLIAGSGPMGDELKRLAVQVGVADRVRFLGEVPHSELVQVYRAADVLVLASEREGWANVLLEAMACGTPVVATNVNGTSEVVRAPAAGVLMADRTPAALVAALTMLRCSNIHREETRAYASGFGWNTVARANKALLFSAAAAGHSGRYNPHLLVAARMYAAIDGVPR